MPTQNGGQALIQSLLREGIRVVFGIPGAGQYEAIDALYATPEIQYISVRNEQSATYMADAYARTSGEIAAVLLVPGPGLYNATAGMATAFAVSSPTLVISGSREPSTPEADSDELAVMKRLSKWAAAAHSVEDIPTLVSEAVCQLKSGRPRPVGLEISPQIFASTAAVEFPEPKTVTKIAPDDALIQRGIQLLTEAERPVLWIGGGVQRADASNELTQLAEHLQIPVVTSKQGKGAFSDRSPLSLGLAELRYAPLREWLHERDLIVAVGTSVNLSAFEQQIIRIDVDPQVIGTATNVIGIESDAKVALDTLAQAAKAATTERHDRIEPVQSEVRTLNMARFGPDDQLHPQWELMIAIRNALPDDGILVQGMTQMGYYSRNYFPVFASRSYLTASSHATLGCAYPLALGAKVAAPDRAVVAISGDGGFLYNAQELATAVQYSINAVVIVFNDNAYGNVLRAQEEEFDGHVIGTKLHNPDFVQLATAYGVKGVLAKDAAELEAALREAIAADVPTLIEVPVGPMDRVY